MKNITEFYLCYKLGIDLRYLLKQPRPRHLSNGVVEKLGIGGMRIKCHL